MNRIRRCVTLFALLPLLLASAWGQGSGRTNPKPLVTPTPTYPEALRDSGRSGTATIEFTVGADGRTSGATVKSADHPSFGEAALAVLPEWRFEPGTLNGKAAPVKVALPFQFNAPPDQQINATFGRKVFFELPETPVPAAQFRGSTSPLNTPRVPYPRSHAGSGRQESVQVEFVITPEGRAVNPVVQNEVPGEFAALAIMHVAGLVFEPPVKDGKPVYVQAHRTVRFAERLEAPEPTK